VLGDPGAKVLLWRVHSTLPAVATYPAVALVDSGPWSLPTVLPALRAMGLPAAYRQSLVGKTFPPAPADLPDAVTVFPRVNGGCQSAAAHRVAVMAESTSPTLALQVDGTASHLGLLARSARLPGWGAYGPVTIPAGLATITTPSGGPTVGPCVAWSPLAAAAFGAHANITGPVHVGAGGEQVKATTVGTGGPWVELRRGYDVGWHLDGKHPTAVGDGLFNLYYDPGAGVRHYTFTFSTHIWERLGELISLMALLGTVALIWVVGRRERRDGLPVAHEIVLESRVAPLVGALGMVFLGLTAVATTLSWFGFPSHLPGTAITSNPYTLDVLFGSMALVLLALSMLVRLGENAVRLRHVRLPTFVRRHPNGAIAVVLSGCLVFTLAVGVVQNHRHSPNKVPGATLIEGKVAQQQKNGALCIADYTFALKAYAALPSAYVQRARCYLTSGQDAAGAVHDLDHALALTPDDPIYLFLRAEADTATGNVSRARADYLSAAHSPASTPNQLVSVVDGLIGIGELDAAQQVVNLALNRFPGDPIALLAAVDLDVASGNGNQAASDLAQAEEAAGSDSSALGTVLSRACTFEVSRLEYRAALTTCQRSVALNHQLFGAYDGLGVAEAAMGHLDQAIVSASSAIGAFEGAVGPNSQPTGVDGFGLSNLYEARGRLYAENNQPKLAVADFRSALAVLPAGNPNTVIEIRGEITAAQREQA
jgi:tetratricopeptide (TPR) repeat protein